MKRTVLTIGISLFLGLIAVKSQEKVMVPSKDSIQSMLTKMNVPGVAIATIEDGVINQITSVGLMSEEEPLPFDAIFNTASLMKSIMAYLAIALMEEGLLGMGERLDKYWVDPDLEGDKKVKLLTPHIILSHRSGFDNWRWMNEEKKLKFNFEPGTQFGYSGEGYEYLRRALESKFDKSFRELVDEYVFNPIDMPDSYLSWSDELEESRYAGEFKTLEEPYETTKGNPNAADNLLGTAEDLGRFCQEILKRAREEKYEQYFQPQSDVRPGIKFSYGWIRFDNLPNNEYALFSAGSDAGVSAIMCLLPTSNRGIIALSNGENRGMVINLMRLSLGGIGTEIVGRFQ